MGLRAAPGRWAREDKFGGATGAVGGIRVLFHLSHWYATTRRNVATSPSRGGGAHPPSFSIRVPHRPLIASDAHTLEGKGPDGMTAPGVASFALSVLVLYRITVRCVMHTYRRLWAPPPLVFFHSHTLSHARTNGLKRIVLVLNGTLPGARKR